MRTVTERGRVPDRDARRDGAALMRALAALALAASILLASAGAALAAPHDTTLVSRATGGAKANGVSSDAALSGDGRYVAFWSTATNLSSADGDGMADLYRRDLSKDRTVLVSRASGANGAEGRGGKLPRRSEHLRGRAPDRFPVRRGEPEPRRPGRAQRRLRPRPRQRRDDAGLACLREDRRELRRGRVLAGHLGGRAIRGVQFGGDEPDARAAGPASRCMSATCRPRRPSSCHA